MNRNPGFSRRAFFAILAAAVAAALVYGRVAWFDGRAPKIETSAIEAFKARLSGVFLAVEGRVERLLPDDLKPPRHQRFILMTDEGLSLLVAHNIDMAPRVDVDMGSRARIRGEYIWNEKGGVIHKTYPAASRSKRESGWIMILEREKPR